MTRALLLAGTNGRGHISRMEALRQEMEGRGWATTMSLHSLEAPKLKANCPFDVLVFDGVPIPWDGSESRLPKARVVQIWDRPQDRGWADFHFSTNDGLKWAMVRREFRYNPNYHDVWYVSSVIGAQGKDIPGMVATMEQSIVVSGGGVRALEAASLGCPLVLVRESDDQDGQIAKLVEAGAAVVANAVIAEAVAYAIQEKFGLAEAMSKAAHGAVDGRGCERIVDEIEEALEDR